MWLSNYLIQMMEIYNRCELISQIIIIDNAPNRSFNLKSDKLIKVTKGKNIYVNPAWNWGIELATNDRVIIINDDLLFDESDFNKLLELSNSILKDNMIIGPSPNCFKQIGLTLGGLKITKSGTEFNPESKYGFGTCMIMKRGSYTIVPSDILIFHGDVIQHNTNEVYLFNGIEIKTPMSATLKTEFGVHDLARLDHAKAKKYNNKELKKFKI